MPNHSSTAIEFAGVSYRLPNGRTLLGDVSFAVRHGETLVIVGRSGSGKTTTLKLINGLLTASSGRISVAGVPVDDWDIIKLRRGIGYSIQDVGLFPHYTIFENVALIPRLERWAQSRIAARVEEVLSLAGLPVSDFGPRYPDQLSGGQRQRIGLARALAADPPILLMDEPFGALDPITRAELRAEFKRLQQQLNKTTVFVTHDIGEALFLGDRIALMEAGRLRGVYRPEEFLATADSSVKAYVDVFRAGQQMFRD